jgi:hypothetical protein
MPKYDITDFLKAATRFVANKVMFVAWNYYQIHIISQKA